MQEESLLSIFSVVASFWPLLLRFLDDVYQADCENTQRGNLIYKFVAIFGELMQQIFRVASSTSGTLSHLNNVSNVSSRTRQRKVALSASESHHPLQQIAQPLCDFGLGLLNSLDNAKEAHNQILEGCLYLILTEAGYRLREFVFGSSEVDKSGCNKITQLASRSPWSSSQKTQVDVQGAELEAPYLIYMLERCPRVSQNFVSLDQLIIPTSSQSTRDSPPISGDLSAGRLSNLAWARFQNTLLRAVFGKDEPNNFHPSLFPAIECANVPPTLKGNGPEQARDWFKHEIWRLVGWDVLQSKLRGCDTNRDENQ